VAKKKKNKKTDKKTAKKPAKKAAKKAVAGDLLFTPKSAAHLAKMLKDFHKRLTNLEIINGTDTPPPTGTIDFP
jgi:hypothetical protein